MVKHFHKLLLAQLEQTNTDINSIPNNILEIISKSYKTFEEQNEVYRKIFAENEEERKSFNSYLAQIKANEFEAVLNRLPGYISWFDYDLNYLGVSSNLAKFYNKNVEDFNNKRIGDFTGSLSSTFTLAILKFVRSDSITCSFEHKIKNDKEEIDIIVYLQKIESDKMILAFGVDVTEKNKLQKEIDNKRALDGHNNRMLSLGEMAAGIAHEINNPLAIIQGNLQLLKREMDNNGCEKQKLKVAKIDHSIERISKILSNLKLLSRNTEIDLPVKTCIKSMSESAMELSGFKAKSKNINITYNIENECYVKCVPTELVQVIHNLVNNAIDAVENLENPWIEFNASKKNGKIQISVTDSGEGIPVTVADKIWLPFFTTKEPSKGTGLGLPICKTLLHKNNGELYYDNKFKHTRFIIDLEEYNDSEDKCA